MDETRLQVLDESDRLPTSQSPIWVRRGGPPDHPIILFDYDPSRSAAVPLRLLAGFSGILVTDGYAGYDAAVRDYILIHVGCWAHARRKFDEAVKAQTSKGKKPKAGRATKGLSFIRKLYRIERLATDQELSPEQRLVFRQQHAQPINDDGQWPSHDYRLDDDSYLSFTATNAGTYYAGVSGYQNASCDPLL